MRILRLLKGVVRRLDRLSPYPLFYPIVMSEKEKALFDRAIRYSRHYLEFGFGGSSLRALLKSKAKIYTVESSPEWIDFMRKYVVVRYFENKRLFIFPVDIGPTRDWGFPESDSYRDLFPSYSSDIFRFINKREIDMVFVDGRFRVACVLKTILECHSNNNLKILIHDFWTREHYQVVLKYLNILERVDSMGRFSIKDDIDLDEVRRDYEIYKEDPL